MALEWSDIETAASRIFNIWNSGGDLAFAREAWTHLAAARLADDEGPVARTQSLLRLLALRQICGEFSSAKWEEGTGDEWYPRVRGTRSSIADGALPERFIPARAGNAMLVLSACWTTSVHPRACGERASTIAPSWTTSGSSPRVRGTLIASSAESSSKRFIPARAGNAR
jgi:hypothetical protein